MSDKAYITPKILKWARESARMSPEVAAAKVLVTPEKLLEWEDEKFGVQPTISQAEKLAKAYRRPFAIFFLPEIPRDFQPLKDFRRPKAKPLSTASIFIIREIQQKQAWIRDMFEDNNEQTLPFVGRFSIKNNPVQIANDILKTLKINPANYTTSNPIKEWINKAEANGIFISRTSFIHSHLKLDSDELQGFTIADPYAPFVFINSDDWGAPLLFSLVHELAHIWIAESGISNEIEPVLKHKDKLNPIELFCNEVAANALMPAEMMKKTESSVFTSHNAVFMASKNIGVSSFAFLFRALNLQMISSAKYQQLKIVADREFQAFLLREAEKEKKKKEKKKKGGPDHYLLLLNKNSRLFTQIVIDAFRGGTIQPSQASNLLNTQINNIPKLENFIYA